MLLLELAQARLGKADACRDGRGETKGEENFGEQRLGGEGEVLQDSDVFFAGVGLDIVGVGAAFSQAFSMLMASGRSFKCT